MNRGRVFFGWGICLLGLALAGYFFSWDESSTEVLTTGHSTVEVTVSTRECLYAGWPHAKGIYLSSGATQVSLKTDAGKIYRFNSNEELRLVGVHFHGDAPFLVFVAHYEPARGFLAFAYQDHAFEAIDLAQLPPESAFANIGSRGATARRLFATSPLPSAPPGEFYETATAWLWSQMMTGKPVLVAGMDRNAVKACWAQWAIPIAESIHGQTGGRDR